MSGPLPYQNVPKLLQPLAMFPHTTTPSTTSPPDVAAALREAQARVTAATNEYAKEMATLAAEIARAEVLLDVAREAWPVYSLSHARVAAHATTHLQLLAASTDGGNASGTMQRGDPARWRCAQAAAGATEEMRAEAASQVSRLEAQLSWLAIRRDMIRSVYGGAVHKEQQTRDALLARLSTDTAPLCVQPPAPLPPAAPTPTQPNKDELKAIRERIRRDEWDDLPAFHGTGDMRQRECMHCGAPVDPEHRRFCSRECHEMHLNAYGSASIPRRHRVT